MRTAVGVGIGALLGLFAGPIGAAVGALEGGTAGAAADAVKEDQRENTADEAFFTLGHGQSAIVADISENLTSILDEAMQPIGGTVYRRMNTATTNAAFGPYYSNYLYPYYYDPKYN